MATPQPVHSGTICSSGTTCQIGGTDRRLGDYHTNAVTADGTFVIAYPDTSFKPQGAISHPGFVAQAAGSTPLSTERSADRRHDDFPPRCAVAGRGRRPGYSTQTGLIAPT